ncbi:MAG: glycoside hydrolase family 13 protein [Clostridia bacterium]|nr:glycoside hydrolase family 13 protein [Clostridia bacterium]
MIFDSRKTEYKSPFGAVLSNQKVKFTFPAKDGNYVYSAHIIIRKGDETKKERLDYVGKSGEYSLFSKELTFEKGIYYYSFELDTEKGIEVYGKGEESSAISGSDSEFQLTVYDNYKTPDWCKGGIIYHVFVDRFSRASDRKKGVFHENWYDMPNIKSADGKYHADDFFGGDLEGIIQKIPYLKSLGVNVLYLSPIFKSFSNHRYDTGNYLEIDELIGDEKTFSTLCKECEKVGIGVMLDGVFNHSGSDSIYFNKHNTYDSVGAYNDKSSPYHDWYYFDTFPDGYLSWWGIRNVPTLNKNNPEYRNLIFGKGGVIEKWTMLGAKGWRLDVADELPSEFIEKIRHKLKSINPDALLIGEVWEDASVKFSYGTYRPYLLGNELDGVMNYPFRNAVLGYAMGGSAKEFEKSVMQIVENYPKCALDSVMNFIGTHDTVRALNALSGVNMPGKKENQLSHEFMQEQLEFAKKRLMLATVIEYTLPGIPSIFYGDEVGMTGWSDPLNRGTYPWGREDGFLLKFFQRLGKIRRENRDVFLGNIEFVQNELLIYKRKSEKGELTVVANSTDKEIKVDILGVDLLSEKKFNGIVAPYSAYVIKEK